MSDTQTVLNGPLFEWGDIKPIVSLGVLANIVYWGGEWLHAQQLIGEFGHLTMVTTGVLMSFCAVVAFLIRVVHSE